MTLEWNMMKNICLIFMDEYNVAPTGLGLLKRYCVFFYQNIGPMGLGI